jgi:hypothetical protein
VIFLLLYGGYILLQLFLLVLPHLPIFLTRTRESFAETQRSKNNLGRNKTKRQAFVPTSRSGDRRPLSREMMTMTMATIRSTARLTTSRMRPLAIIMDGGLVLLRKRPPTCAVRALTIDGVSASPSQPVLVVVPPADEQENESKAKISASTSIRRKMPQIPPPPTWSLNDLRLSKNGSDNSNGSPQCQETSVVSLDDLKVLAKRACIDLDVYKRRLPPNQRQEGIEVLRQEVENMIHCLSVVSDYIGDADNAKKASALTDEDIYDSHIMSSGCQHKHRKSAKALREALDAKQESRTGQLILDSVRDSKMIKHDNAIYFKVSNHNNKGLPG